MQLLQNLKRAAETKAWSSSVRESAVCGQLSEPTSDGSIRLKRRQTFAPMAVLAMSIRSQRRTQPRTSIARALANKRYPVDARMTLAHQVLKQLESDSPKQISDAASEAAGALRESAVTRGQVGQGLFELTEIDRLGQVRGESWHASGRGLRPFRNRSAQCRAARKWCAVFPLTRIRSRQANRRR